METQLREVIEIDLNSLSPVSPHTRDYAEQLLEEISTRVELIEEKEKEDKGKGKEDEPWNTAATAEASNKPKWPNKAQSGCMDHVKVTWTPARLHSTSTHLNGIGESVSILVDHTIEQPNDNWNGPTKKHGWPPLATELQWGGERPQTPRINTTNITFAAYSPSPPFKPDKTKPPIPFFKDQVALEHINGHRPVIASPGTPISLTLHVMAIDPNARAEVVRTLRAMSDVGVSSDLHQYKRLTREVAGVARKIRDYELYLRKVELTKREVVFRLLKA